MKHFGQRLKKLREDRNMSVKEIAFKVGVAPSTFREWEYGREIKGEPYVKIAEVLEIGVYELLTGETPNLQQASESIYQIEKACVALRKSLGSLK